MAAENAKIAALVDRAAKVTGHAADPQTTGECSGAYARDRETVWTLAHAMAPGDRSRAGAWLVKLDECGDPEVRSQYAGFLLAAAAGGSLRTEPFRQLPPLGPLKRLGEIVNPTTLSRLPRSDPAATGPTVWSVRPAPAQKTTRGTFLGRQPIPEDGTYCYAAAFSTM